MTTHWISLKQLRYPNIHRKHIEKFLKQNLFKKRKYDAIDDDIQLDIFSYLVIIKWSHT